MSMALVLLLPLRLFATELQPSLDWLSGCWLHEDGRTMEIWSHSYDGLLFGYSISRKEEMVVAFEDLRIEPRGGGSAYLASPNGRAVTEFNLVQHGPQSVTFAQPAHDYPQRIEYRREGDRLTATIAKLDGSRAHSFAMDRCD